MADIIEAAKLAALQAVEASKPVRVYYGTVTNTDPLEINLDQKMTLQSMQLVLSRHVTDYTAEMTVDHETEKESEHIHDIDVEMTHTHAIQDSYTGGGSSSPTEHSHTMQPTEHAHAYAGRKTYTVHNSLAIGDKVVLLRVQGGQKYVVLDRVGV